MNRIVELFNRKPSDILNIYFTAGHPTMDSTVEIIEYLERAGVDLVEVGIPYSDPLADGLTIQQSAQKALKNGMTLEYLFEQIKQSRKSSRIPIILMGNYNQMLQYGPEKFISDAKTAGADGFIIPDLPMEVYQSAYEGMFDDLDLVISFLVTPQTSNDRLKLASALSKGFLYIVSKSSITGFSGSISDDQKTYFQKINSLLKGTPKLMGFGIHDRKTYETACQYFNGAIIGSAFIRALEAPDSLAEKVSHFVRQIR